MSSLAIDELRSHLNTFIQSLTSGATTSDIISGFRRSYARSIAKAQIDLENIGLTKMVNSVGKLRPAHAPGEPDLFSGFGVPNTIVVRPKNRRALHVPLAKASIAEAKDWASGTKRPPKRSADQIEVERLISEIEPFAEDEGTTVEAALHVFRQGNQAQKVKL